MKSLIRNQDTKVDKEMKDLLFSYENLWLTASEFVEFFDELDLFSVVGSDEQTIVEWIGAISK